MIRLRKTMTEGEVAKIRRLRAQGMPWSDIALRLGRRHESVRAAVDEAYAEVVRARVARYRAKARAIERTGKAPETVPAVSTKDVDRLMRRLPPDTRSPMQVLLGDPRPGRELMRVDHG